MTPAARHADRLAEQAETLANEFEANATNEDVAALLELDPAFALNVSRVLLGGVRRGLMDPIAVFNALKIELRRAWMRSAEEELQRRAERAVEARPENCPPQDPTRK